MANSVKGGKFLTTVAIALGLAGGAYGQGAVTDPVGYITNTILGTGSVEGATKVENLITIALVGANEVLGTISAVNTDSVTLDGDFTEVEASLNERAGSHFVEIRTGAGQGLILELGRSSGSTFYLPHFPAGILAPGDHLYIRKNHTLADLLGPNNELNFLSGTDALSVDNVVLLDPVTQNQRAFYFHDDGEGVAEWREAGSPEDAGGTIIPFPTGLMVIRRGVEDLTYINVGHVPYYRDDLPVAAFLPVWPGQNLLSLPFNIATLESSGLYTPGSPFSVIAGGDASEADVIIINNNETTQTFNPVYYRAGEGWRRVGEDGDAADFAFPFTSASRYVRVGDAGWVRFNSGLGLDPGAARHSPRVHEVAGTTIAPLGRDSVNVSWPSEDGVRYKIQRRELDPAGTKRWVNLPEIHTGDGSSKSVAQPTNASAAAYFRVIQLRGQ